MRSPMDRRTFPPPWRVKDNGSAFYIEDKLGHTFAFTYYREHAVVGTGPWHLTPDEARRIVANIARLPALLKKAGKA